MKNNKSSIYLISPDKIDNQLFYKNLEKIFSTKKISIFQLRLKNVKKSKIIYTGKKINKICKKYKVKFIINDSPYIAKKLNADGCHIGQNDIDYYGARRILGNKIIGVTCNNSIKLIRNATLQGADYVAIGAFFKTNTKKTLYSAKLNLINHAKKITHLPIVVIGGINSKNYKKLLLHKPSFLAISGHIWNNNNPIKALKKINI